jgi:heat shock protein HslJ
MNNTPALNRAHRASQRHSSQSLAKKTARRLCRAAVVSGLIAATALLAACRDETLTGYGAADKIWVLSTLNQEPFEARATLSFPDAGKLSGQAPCNGYQGEQTAPYPWFQAGALITTRMICPDQPAEDIYLQTLAEMTEAEVAGDVLILRNEAGLEMVFTSED